MRFYSKKVSFKIYLKECIGPHFKILPLEGLTCEISTWVEFNTGANKHFQGDKREGVEMKVEGWKVVQKLTPGG